MSPYLSTRMSRKPWVIIILVVLAYLAGNAAEAQFFQEPWPPAVETVLPEKASAQGEELTLTFSLKLEPGLHLYKDKIEFTFAVLEGAEYDRAVLPGGHEVPDLVNPGETVEVFEEAFSMSAVFRVTAAAGESIVINGQVSVMGCTDELCYPPHQEKFAYSAQVLPGGAPVALAKSDPTPALVTEEAPPYEISWLDLLLRCLGAFGAGILLSLTPCVLPLVPITSAIIQRFSKGGKASALYASCIYVLGLALTYAAAGVAVAFVGGAVRSFLNSPWVLASIGGIFVVLSLSMFGLFDISMPSGFAGKLQKTSATQANKKNKFALLLMGMIAGIVAGPCLTAPLAALLAWIAQTGSPVIGFVTMFSLAWGIGLLIIVAGTFTGMVPRAGEWMEWFKKFFGFMMIWGALYFTRSLIGDAVYEVGTILLLVISAVFLGGLDSLPTGAGWALRMKKLIGVFCIMGAFFLGLNTFADLSPSSGAGVESGKELGGFRDGGAADLKAALDAGRPAVLFFTAPWCAICKPLKKDTLYTAQVAQALEGIEALTVNFDVEQALAEKYKIQGPPTVVFIDSQGHEKKDLRFSGMKSIEEFLGLLKSL